MEPYNECRVPPTVEHFLEKRNFRAHMSKTGVIFLKELFREFMCQISGKGASGRFVRDQGF